MNKLIYNILLLGVGIIFWTACNQDEERTAYSTAGARTELGRKIVEHSGFIGHYFADSTYTLNSGVTVLELKGLSSTGLATQIFLFEIDLNLSHLNIVASAPNDDDSRFAMQPMSQQVMAHDKEGRRVLGAVNGDFFDMKNGTPRGIFHRQGRAVKSDIIDPTRTFFAITKDKKAIIGSYNDYATYKNEIQEAVGGWTPLITDGFVMPQTSDVLEPRTCVGVTADNTVYLMVVDGRNFWYSNGMSFQDMARVMKSLGVQNAINLDGGGSSTFVIRNWDGFDKDTRFEIRNWPSDNGGKERAVGNGLLIVTDN